MLSFKPFAVRPSDPVHDPNLPFDAGSDIDKIVDFFQEFGINFSGQHPLRSLSKNMSLAQEHTVLFVRQHPSVVG